MIAMPEPRIDTPHASSPADLLALALGATDAGLDLETELDLGAFLCACPDLQLHGCLGRGGMGVVYRARQVRLDRDVAVKLMSPAVARDSEFAQRFEREAKALARLDHPGIVAVHDFGQAAGVYYIVMELVEGPNLRELMRHDIELGQAAEIVGQLCDALAYAHDRGVVHRDIKPENVLLDRHGRVRVADFGLAKLQRDDRTTTMHTRRVMGTPQYMAPEQVRDPGAVDHRSDIFAIGVVFYELLTGQLPVGRFPPPSELGKGDARLDEIVLRALEFSRERRYQAASEIRAALSTRRDAIDRPTIAAPRSRMRWWLGGGAAAAAAVAVAIVATSSDPPAVETEASSDVAAADAPAPVETDEAARNRWPARALATLDPAVAGVVGVDWSEIRQAPLVAVFGEAALTGAGEAAMRCKHDVVDRTHKLLVGLLADGSLHEIVAHGDWTPAQLEGCLRVVDDDSELQWKTTAVGGHTRIEVTGTTTRVVTIGQRGTTIVVSFDPEVTTAAIDAKLAATPTSTEIRDRVAAAVDLGAPVWGFAEPTAGLLPLEMITASGMIELWDEIAVDATATFPSDAAAAKAKLLIESYANVIASLPEVELAPKLAIEQVGAALRVKASLAIPVATIQAQIHNRIEGEAIGGEIEAKLRFGDE